VNLQSRYIENKDFRTELNQINIENPHFFIFENNNAVMMFKYLLICVCFI
jgi:hypothetical protein